VSALETAGFAPRRPEGAYYVLCDITPFGFDDDTAFARWLTREVGVAGVPGSSFYSEPTLGKHLIRFTFCKTQDVLEAAAQRLMRTGELAAKRLTR
jgi:aspartate/methionine/tyrosine aminotransferase